ncbi:WD40-repeat-containing domain protein [Suillus tomentosus]|nr:WD40-repeat-containing domain protein [Suillus tomentosus]
MASNSMQPGTTENKSILTPVRTLEGHQPWKYSLQDSDEFSHISCISYSADGKQMISGSGDKTIRRWDLREGKEIKETREVCDNGIDVMGVSRDGRWIVTVDWEELKVTEVETGIVRTFHIGWINCIDISADSALVAGGSYDGTRIWSLDTGKLVAGPFKNSEDCVSLMTALRLSEDSRKLAVSLNSHLQVWDINIQAQKLLVQKSIPGRLIFKLPVFWTTKDKSIIAASISNVTDDFPVARTIYEYDASTLKTVGAPFKHDLINSLALSSDCVLLASSSCRIIKLWAFESRQLLASFDVSGSPSDLVFSPNSRQLACTRNFDDDKIVIYDIPANILASIGLKEPHPNNNKSERSCHVGLLDVCGLAFSFIYTTLSFITV